MSKADYPLTPAMFAAILRVTRIENPAMVEALRAVLVDGEKVSPTAVQYGFKRQQLHVRVRHILDEVKPAFDDYAALVLAQAAARRRRTSG